MSPDPWTRLAEVAPQALVDHVREVLSSHGRVTFHTLTVERKIGLSAGEVQAGLLAAVNLGLLERETQVVHTPCGSSLGKDDIAAGVCPHDDSELRPEELSQDEVFVRHAPPGRDVPWVLCVHGMNTRGAWQEALAWRVSTAYFRSVPVYIYKYGWVVLGVLLPRRQKAIADKLATTIKRLAGEPEDSRLGPRPDVVAHSFGTWMIGHALLWNEDVEVGRVVLVASILDPAFPWQTLIDRGQVDAVMLHRGGKDLPVRLAAYAIPDSGPSGRRGFDPGVPVLDRFEPSFSHSTFFNEGRLRGMLLDVWKPFLTTPQVSTEHSPSAPNTSWTPPPRLVRFVSRSVILLVAGTLAGATAVTFVRGVASYF